MLGHLCAMNLSLVCMLESLRSSKNFCAQAAPPANNNRMSGSGTQPVLSVNLPTGCYCAVRMGNAILGFSWDRWILLIESLVPLFYLPNGAAKWWSRVQEPSAHFNSAFITQRCSWHFFNYRTQRESNEVNRLYQHNEFARISERMINNQILNCAFLFRNNLANTTSPQDIVRLTTSACRES